MKGIATMADILAIEEVGMPRDLPRSTYEMIRTAAERHPKAPALSFFLRASDMHKPEQWDYAALLARIHQAANLFHSLGADKDSVIAFVLPNLPETHFVIWGGQVTGIVAAINPLLEPSAIAELLKSMGASILVTLAPFPGTDLWQKLKPVIAEVPMLRHVLLVSLADRVHGFRKPIARFLKWRASRQLHGSPAMDASRSPSLTIQDFGRATAKQPYKRLLSNRQIDPDDYSSFFCTGGTTGLPKIAMRRHSNEVANAWSAAQFLGDGIGPGKNIFCGLPLFHVNGVLVTGLLPLSKGAHVILGTPQGYRGDGVIKNFWRIVEQFHIHFFSGVPTLFAALLQVPVNGHRIDSLEYGLCGAAPLPHEIFRRFQEDTGLKILEGYGLTEATCVSSVNPPLGERRLGSIGLRIPGQAIKVVKVDGLGHFQRDCEAGEAGVLIIGGPNVFAGYKVPEQNLSLWMDCGDGLRWLHTGDLGYHDVDGYFWLTGRTKELIIRGGHNIDPAVIEQPLHGHAAVQWAAAVGRPDPRAGELPVVYVQLRPGVHITQQELLTYLAEHITERAALPKALMIIDEIPLTAIGKIYKPALKRMQIESALSQALKDAGVPFNELIVSMDDGNRGVFVTVELATNQSEAQASTVLGQFPFTFAFTTKDMEPANDVPLHC